MNISDHEGIQDLMDDLGVPLKIKNFEPRYNVAPGAAVLALYGNESGQGLQAEMMQWGIVPPWAKPDKPMRPLFNARSETVWEKPSFKYNIRSRRGIVPANGFYEWQRTNKHKQAYYVAPTRGGAFAFAAIYQTDRDGIMQCCLLTTDANSDMARVHDRMPVIISVNDVDEWVHNPDPEVLNRMMLPCANDDIDIRPVSDFVNNSRHEGPQCLR